jgi:rod shape-determining protein MreD
MRLTFLAMTLGGSVAQTSMAAALSLAGVPPDLPMILIVFWALRRGPEAGCLAGFLTGLLQDVTGGGMVGVQALTKALAGFGMGLVAGRLWAANPLVQVPAVVVLTVAEGLLRFALLQLFHYRAPLPALLVDVILPQALYNGALGAAALVALYVTEAVRLRVSWR